MYRDRNGSAIECDYVCKWDAHGKVDALFTIHWLKTATVNHMSFAYAFTLLHSNGECFFTDDDLYLNQSRSKLLSGAGEWLVK